MSTSGSAKVRQLHIRILDQLESYLDLTRDSAVLVLCRERISNWNVAQHLEHLALVDRSILARLETADENIPQDGRPTLIGRVMLVTGFIRRGRGRAPSITDPRVPELDSIEPKLTEVQQRFLGLGDDLRRLETGHPLAKHFAFGYLNGRQWLRFIGVHHHHHWKIIRDIRRAD